VSRSVNVAAGESLRLLFVNSAYLFCHWIGKRTFENDCFKVIRFYIFIVYLTRCQSFRFGCLASNGSMINE
jgi:hypothetical protein